MKIKVLKEVNNFFQRVNEDHVGEYAAKCAYFTFLSFIPFIILLLSIIKYINIDKETLEYILEAFLPTIAKNSVVDIIQEMYSKSFQVISISAIFTLWSAANSFYALSLGLSSVYKDKNKNNFLLLRVKGIVGTIIVLLTIIMVLILLIFGNKINVTIQENFKSFSGIVNFIINIRSLIVIISLFFIFTLMYRFIPNQKGSSLKKQFPGAIFASVRLVCYFIFFFNLYRYIYKFFYNLWKSYSNNFNYDVVIFNNIYNFTWCRN